MIGVWQEAGRAGRDGLPAECVLMTCASDAGRVAQILRNGTRSKAKLAPKLELLTQACGPAASYACVYLAQLPWPAGLILPVIWPVMHLRLTVRTVHGQRNLLLRSPPLQSSI